MAQNRFTSFQDLTYRFERKRALEILDNIKAMLPLESTCWAAGVDPDEFEAEMQRDPELKRSVMRQFALAERELVSDVRTQGGPGLTRGKAALEILSRCFRAWSGRTTGLVQSLENALDELERKLDREAYRTVLQVLSKH